MKLKYILFVFLSFLVSDVFPQANNNETINLNISQNISARESVIGFLHFSDLTHLQDQIKILKPGYWRAGSTIANKDVRKIQVQKLLDNKIRPIIVISDIYGYPFQNRKGWVLPYSDPSTFTNLVKQLYNEWHSNIIYDVWNEPNLSYWKGSTADFFNVFKIAHDIIRAAPGGNSALITGPSISGFYRNYIDSFLNYCNENHIRVDILNWHENGDKKNAAQMMGHIQYVKQVLLKKYPNVGVQQIFIPEITRHADQYDPLSVFSYIYFLEKGGATAGCKSCWNNAAENGGNTCWNNSMDGIIDQNGNPRSVWWVYKYYAESLDYRLNNIANSDSLLSIAYTNSRKDTLSIMLASINSTASKININLKNIKSLQAFNKSKSCSYRIFQIPNTAEKELSTPISSEETQIKLNGTNLSIPLKEMDNKSVYVLKIHI